MFSLNDPDIIHGFWGTYAIEPLIYIIDFLEAFISFNIENKNDDFPLPMSPITMVKVPE